MSRLSIYPLPRRRFPCKLVSLLRRVMIRHCRYLFTFAAPPEFPHENRLFSLTPPQDLKIELKHPGAVSDAARNGEAVNVRAGVGGAAPSMLCMPVYGADGLVAGVVQVVGKKYNGKTRAGG